MAFAAREPRLIDYIPLHFRRYLFLTRFYIVSYYGGWTCIREGLGKEDGCSFGTLAFTTVFWGGRLGVFCVFHTGVWEYVRLVEMSNRTILFELMSKFYSLRLVTTCCLFFLET